MESSSQASIMKPLAWETLSRTSSLDVIPKVGSSSLSNTILTPFTATIKA